MNTDELIVLLKQEMASGSQSLHGSSKLHKALYEFSNEVVPFDWGNWNKGKDALSSRDFSALTRYEHLMLFVALIRYNRFCDGALSSALASGLLLDIAQSLNSLET